MNCTEAYFIDHCEGGCGLGRFQYECPRCSAIEDDFEVWFKGDEIYKGETVFFKCENCGCELYVKYDDFEYKVYINE